MKVSITREYTWEMGHALMNHAGKCYRPHGHNYRMEVEIFGPMDESSRMILDFADLDQLVKPRIDRIDHRFVVNEDDVRFGADDAYIKWRKDPTAESIAIGLFLVLDEDIKGLDEDITLERVTLYETDKASATVRRT